MDSIAKDLFNEHIPTPSQIIKKKKHHLFGIPLQLKIF
ncbi:hypothetical protein ABH968_005490 [Lysinibacillus sp. RC79]